MGTKNKICGIYKITNNTNGKIYIGQSVDILSRWSHHRTCCNNPKCHEYHSPFYRALRKYGYKNFTYEILEECSIDTLDDKEIEYIKEYNSFTGFDNCNGYNNSIGGNQGSRFRQKSDEEKRKISENRDYKSGSEHHEAKPVIYKGVIYGYMGDFMDDFVKENDVKTSINTIKCWLNGTNSMPQKYYDLGLSYVGEEFKRIRRNDNACERCITWIDGIKFDNAKLCSDYIGNIKPATLRSYLSKARQMPKSLYDRGLHYDKYNMSEY